MSRREHTTPLGDLSEGDIHRLLGYQLAQTAVVTTQAFESEVGRPLGLRPVEFTILQLVRENRAVSPTRLSQALDMTVPGVKTWVDRLEARGFVRRSASQKDRRSQHIEATAQGASFVADAVKRLLKADQQLLGGLSVGEQHMLLELLRKVSARRRG